MRKPASRYRVAGFLLMVAKIGPKWYPPQHNNIEQKNNRGYTGAKARTIYTDSFIGHLEMLLTVKEFGY